MLFILAQSSRELLTHVAVVHTVTGHELPRVHVVAVPRLLASVERTRVGVALALQVKDGVDRAGRATVTHPNHNSVLVRTHDVGDARKHSLNLL